MLNLIEAQYYFDNLIFIAENPDYTTSHKLLAMDNIFLSVVNLLTEKREKQIFAGLFAKINFICQVYELGEDWEQELQALRNILRKNAIQKKFQPTENQVLVGLKLLAELIQKCAPIDAGVVIPTKLAVFWQEKELQPLIQKQKPQKVIPFLACVLLSKGEISKQNNKGTITLFCQTEEIGKVSILVTDIQVYSQGKLYKEFRLSDYCKWYIPYQNLLFTNLEAIDEQHLATTDNTLVVLEPDYLIDASSIARCFTPSGKSPYLYLLDKFSFFRGNEHTLGGNLINEMLDELIVQPKTSFEQAYKIAIAKNSLAASQIEPDVLMNIHQQLEPQFDNLVKTLKAFDNQNLTTEPTFISAQFGLQGRIDVLSEDKQKKQRKDVIELKSSKSFPQLQSANYYDLIQVACYNLLIDSTFENRNGISAILYSRDFLNPLRDCGKLNFEKQEAMEMRNRIVAIDFSIARNPEKILNNLFSFLYNANLPEYKLTEARLFDHHWRNAPPLHKAYFSQLLSMVARERLIAKIGSVTNTDYSDGFASIWKKSPAEKIENFTLLEGLELQEFDDKNLTIKFLRTKVQATSFRENDIILVYPTTENKNALAYSLLKGNIKKINSEEVIIKLWSRYVTKEYFDNHKFWAIEPLLLEKNFDSLYASLALFLSVTEERRDLILGLYQPTFQIPSDWEKFYAQIQNKISEQQAQILKQALAAQQYFLLQGPPGTGKTSQMLRQMVAYLYEYTQETIVLLAFTNRATDEICDKIKDVCLQDFIRLGISEEEGNFADVILKENKNLASIREKLQKNRVFISTVASFYNNMQYISSFDTLIVDEASQLTEPYLCGILPLFKKFILIGDEKQLPAVVIQPAEFCKTENPLLQAIHLKDLSTSVFERLLINAQQKKWYDCFAMLDKQFRTHEDIANFISKEFYKTLHIGSTRQAEPLKIYSKIAENEIEKNLAQGRIVFIPSNTERQTKIHRAEAQKVALLLKTIQKVYGEKFNAQTVGVITPYKAQLAEIFKLLDKDLQTLVTIDTVERYQGSEREIIIISMAVNHEVQLHNLQMLNALGDVDRKLNVALSRAKEQLILLGNPYILQKSVFYQKLLNYIPYHWNFG